MLIIDSSAAMARALASSLEEQTKNVLAHCRAQLTEFDDYDLGELGRWIVVDDGDRLDTIEAALGLPIAADHPPWEWVVLHGSVYEAPVILTDDGFGHVLIVPDLPGIDAALLVMLRQDAVSSD